MPFAVNSGIKIHYQVIGKGPPLMLVHGFGGSLSNWIESDHTLELSKDHRLILVDVRGFGDSDKPHDSSDYAFQNLVADLIAILDKLKIEKTDYLGYSMGGRIGFRIPIYASQRFNSLIIGGAAYPISGEEDSKDDALVFINQTLEAAIKEDPQKPMEFFVTAFETRMGLLSESRKSLFLANDPIALQSAIRAFRGAVSPKSEEVLPKIALPVLLFVGEVDPRFPTVKECALRVPRARFVSLPGLDHVQAGARADLTLPHVKMFLNEFGLTEH
jgi:pimeloyl-ACP methyl ester carboxylesterase